MGKNQKHKKQVKSEKSKVKLRLKGEKTKFLPKGLNVTDTNFKIKPIVIREQLKNYSDQDLLTKRKLSVKDLLARLKHYNAKVKCEGCDGFCELLANFGPEIFEQNLNQILQNACQLILDQERKVRRKSIKLIHAILEHVPVEKIRPFFHVLTSFASCAMTNLNREIQEDSLLIIDGFITFTPSLIVDVFEKIFSNFLSLISKLRADFQPDRTLSVNLTSTFTSIKWRIEVLIRLKSILKIIVDKNAFSKIDTSKIPTYKMAEIDSLQVYKTIRMCPMNFLSKNETTDMENQIFKYTNVLIPLLQETWAEALPTKSKTESVLDQDAANNLNCIITVFYYLWKLTSESTFVDKRSIFENRESQSFLNSIISMFPYQQKQIRITKGVNVVEDPKLMRENLLISFLYVSINKKLIDIEKAHSIIDYLNSCLESKITNDNLIILSATLNTIFNNQSWIDKIDNVLEILNNLLEYQKQNGGDETDEIFKLLCDLIDKPFVQKSEIYNEWIKTLPNLLCKATVSEKVIDTLSILVRQGNFVFQNALLEKQPEILGNLDEIFVLNSENEQQSLLKILSLFYYSNMSCEHYGNFLHSLQKKEVSKMVPLIRESIQMSF